MPTPPATNQPDHPTGPANPRRPEPGAGRPRLTTQQRHLLDELAADPTGGLARYATRHPRWWRTLTALERRRLVTITVHGTGGWPFVTATPTNPAPGTGGSGAVLVVVDEAQALLNSARADPERAATIRGLLDDLTRATAAVIWQEEQR